MFLKRVFYASGSILFAVAAYHFCARNAVAEPRGVPLLTVSKLYSGEVFGWGNYHPVHAPITPSALLFGNLPQAGTEGEVAFTQAVLNRGDQVPLPVYADGASAGEDEVFWTVHLWHATWAPVVTFIPMNYTDGDRCDVAFDGRTYTYGHAVTDNQSQYGGGGRGSPTDNVQVLVTVIAVRSAQPTPVKHETLGGIKARYR